MTIKKVLIVIFTLFVLYGTGYSLDKYTQTLLLKLGQIETDLLYKEKYKNFYLISIGKNSKVYSFLLKKDKILFKTTGCILQKDKEYILCNGEKVFNLKWKKAEKEALRENSKFLIKQVNNKWFLYYKNRLRFKSDRKLELIKSKNEYFLIDIKLKKISFYYLKPPKYFPKIVKRIPVFSGYKVKTFQCGNSLYIFQKDLDKKDAYLFIFDLQGKRLVQKLHIKKFIYNISGCSNSGIVLSNENMFFILTKDGSIKKAPKVRISKKEKRFPAKTVQTGKLDNLWLLDDVFVVKSDNVISVFSYLDFSLKNQFKDEGFTDFYKKGDRFVSISLKEKNICVYTVSLDKEPERNFCIKTAKDVQQRISENGIFILDKLKSYFYRYSFSGDLILKEKIPKNVSAVTLTRFGVFYVDKVLVHLKPDGDFEIYEVVPYEIRETDNYIFFRTKKQNYFFNGSKLVNLGKNCEPLGSYKICEEDFYNLYTIYPKRSKSFFLERPICMLDNDISISIENRYLKLYSLKSNSLTDYFSLDEDIYGIKCWEGGIFLIKNNSLEFIQVR